jgi:hypothetical protein
MECVDRVVNGALMKPISIDYAVQIRDFGATVIAKVLLWSDHLFVTGSQASTASSAGSAGSAGNASNAKFSLSCCSKQESHHRKVTIRHQNADSSSPKVY